MPHSPIFVSSHSPSEGASPRSRTAIRSGTAIVTIATALLLATPAQAADECGVLPGGGGTLVCDSVDNPFPDGIYYDVSTGTDDLTLVLGDTVLVQGNSTLFAAVDIFGGVSDITVQLDGSINASGATVRGLNIQTTDGDGMLTGNGTIATLGEFADGIFASATGTGNISVSLTEADPMTGRIDTEPVATIEYQVADWENYSVLGSMVDIENVEGLRGQLGLRIGGTTPIGGAASRLTYYLGGHYMREFDGDGTATLTSTSSTQHVVSDGRANYGRFEAGISILTRSGLSGFIEANGDVGGNYVGVGGRAGLRLVF